jgi:adenylylsulfate kinase
MIILLSGLVGSGKTSIGRCLYEIWKAEAPNTVLVDGDEVRSLVRFNSGDDAYSLEGRHAAASRYCDILTWLDGQDINVICCTISFFEDLRERNRRDLSNYFEVFISVPMEILKQRDVKNLYERAFRGEVKNVVGVDLLLTSPEKPDMIVDNSSDRSNFMDIAEEIIRRARTAR